MRKVHFLGQQLQEWRLYESFGHILQIQRHNEVCLTTGP
jgi:hypothetical protein